MTFLRGGRQPGVRFFPLYYTTFMLLSIFFPLEMKVFFLSWRRYRPAMRNDLFALPSVIIGARIVRVRHPICENENRPDSEIFVESDGQIHEVMEKV